MQHKFHMEGYILLKLNKALGKKKYHVEVWNSLESLEDLDNDVEINIALETTWDRIYKISATERVG
jgi:hypothetical protein